MGPKNRDGPNDWAEPKLRVGTRIHAADLGQSDRGQLKPPPEVRMRAEFAKRRPDPAPVSRRPVGTRPDAPKAPAADSRRPPRWLRRQRRRRCSRSRSRPLNRDGGRDARAAPGTRSLRGEAARAPSPSPPPRAKNCTDEERGREPGRARGKIAEPAFAVNAPRPGSQALARGVREVRATRGSPPA